MNIYIYIYVYAHLQCIYMQHRYVFTSLILNNINLTCSIQCIDGASFQYFNPSSCGMHAHVVHLYHVFSWYTLMSFYWHRRNIEDDLRQSHKDMFLNLEVGYEMGLKPVTSINHEYHQLRKHSDSYSMIGLEKSCSYKNEWNIKENHG
jgi:hypothetical protein